MNRFPRTDLGWKMRTLWGTLARDTWGVRIGKILSLLIIIGFSVGATVFFHVIFEKLLKLPDIGEPLLWRVITLTLVTVAALLVVSNLITGIATIFRSPEIAFLFAKPIQHHRVFLSRFLDNLVYSSWSLAVLGVPILVAWGMSFHISVWVVLFLIIFGLLPLVIIAAELGSLLLIGIIFLVRYTSPRATLLIMVALILAAVGSTVRERTLGMFVEGSARSSTIERYISSLGHETLSPITPSHWLVHSMRDFRKNEHHQGLFFGVLLTLTAAVWLRWLAMLSKGIYYSSWAAFSEISSRKQRTVSTRSADKFTKGWLPNPLNSMLRKDLLEFTRNPSQWGQFLMLVAFLLVYLLNLVYISSRLNFNNPYWKTMVMFLNFAFTGFILATLSVRFVFPLISLEGRSFWVVRSAPVSVNLLFWEKFFLAFVVFMGLCEMIVWFSNRVLNVTEVMMLITTVGTFTMGVALTGLAVGMGALFPDFEEESPMRIASTPGGVMTVILSLAYAALMVFIISWPAKGYFLYMMGRGPLPAGRALAALIGVAAVNVLFILIPIRLGRHSIMTRDI